jgi:hypothetical protein
VVAPMASRKKIYIYIHTHTHAHIRTQDQTSTPHDDFIYFILYFIHIFKF